MRAGCGDPGIPLKGMDWGADGCGDGERVGGELQGFAQGELWTALESSLFSFILIQFKQ